MYNNCNARKETGTVRSNRHECLDCENYKRKIKESEQSLSSRDVLIQMLQREIQKIEDRYKNSIDEYEQLRFSHCTTLQELSNLKEIHKRLEDDCQRCRTGKTHPKHKDFGSEMEIFQKQSHTQDASIQNRCCTQESYNNLFKDVAQAGNIIQSQNEMLKQLLLKFLEEVKQTNCCGSNFREDGIQAFAPLKEIRNGKHDEYISIVEDMNNQIRDLNDIVVKLKQEFIAITAEMHRQLEKANDLADRLRTENNSIKDQLEEKKSVLSSCLCVLEQNHNNITNLSANVENIIHEKEILFEETKNLKEIIEKNKTHCMEKDQEISELKNKLCSIDEDQNAKKLEISKELLDCREHVSQLERELKEKEEEFKVKKYNFSNQLEQSEESNKVLSDTLLIITNENKGNLSKIANLSSELKVVNQELENSEGMLKRYIGELEHQLDTYKIKVVTYEQAHCQPSTSSDREEEIKELHEKIKHLEAELKEVSLENSEYEEENRYFSQKIEGLMRDLRVLEEENYKIEEGNRDCCIKMTKLRKECENINNDKNKEIEELKDEIHRLNHKQDENKSVSEETKSLKTKNENLCKEICELKKLCEDYTNRNNTLTRDLDRVRTERKEIEKEYKKLISNTQMLEQQCNEYNTENCSIKTQISHISDELKALQKDADIQQHSSKGNRNANSENESDEINMLHSELAKKDSEYHHVLKQLQELQKFCYDYNTRNEKLKYKNNLIEEELNRVYEERKKIDSENKILLQQVEALRQRRFDDEDGENQRDTLSIKSKTNLDKVEVRRIKKENEGLRNDMNDLQKKIVAREYECREMRRTIEKLKPAKNEKETHANEDLRGGKQMPLQEQQGTHSVQAQTENLTEPKTNLDKEELKRIRTETEHLVNNIGIVNDKLKTVLQKNQELENENKILKIEIEDLNKYFSRYDNENEKVKSKIDMMDENLKLVEVEKAKIENEYKEIKCQMEKLHQHCSECNEENEGIKKELDTLNQDLKEALEEKIACKAENEKLQETLAQFEKLCIECNKGCQKVDISEKEKVAGQEGNDPPIGPIGVENLQKQHAGTYSRDEEINEKIVIIKQDLSAAQQRRVEVEKENELLKAEIHKLQKHRSNDNPENEEIKFQVVTNELHAARQKTEKLESERENLKNQLENLQTQITDYGRSNQEMTNKIVIITEELTVAQQEKEECKQEIEFLKDEKDKLQRNKSGNDEMKREFETVTNELNTTRREKEKLENEHKNLKKILDTTMQNQITNYEDGSKEMTKKINLLSEKLSVAEQKKAECEKANKMLKIEMDKLQQGIFSNESEIEDLKKKLEKVTNKLHTTQKEKEKSGEDYKILKKQLNDIQKQTTTYEKMKCEVALMTEKFTVTQQLKEEVEKENKEMKTQIDHLQRRRSRQYDVEVEELKNELETVTNKLNQSQLEMGKLDEYYKNMKIQTDLLTEELITAQQKGADVEKENNLLKTQMGELKLGGSNKDPEIKEARKKLEMVTEELTTAQQRNVKVEKENRLLKTQIDELQQEGSSNDSGTDQLKILYDKANIEGNRNFNDDETKNKIDLINEELKKVNAEKIEVVNENKKLKDELNNLQKELRGARETAERQILVLQKKIAELNIDQNNNLDKSSMEIDNNKKFNDERVVDKKSYSRQCHELNHHTKTLENEKLQVQEEIKMLCENLEKCENNYQQLKKIQTQNERKLHEQIEAMERELCERGCMLAHLEECLDKSNNTLGTCDKEMKEMYSHVELLRQENYDLKTELQKFVYESERHKADVLTLQEKLGSAERHSKQNKGTLKMNSKLKDRSNDDFATLSQKYEELIKTHKERNEEFNGLQKQYESLAKTLEDTRTEYNNIKMEYKDLKSSLKHPISNYEAEMGLMDKDPCSSGKKPSTNPCTKELKILEKEVALQILKQTNDDLTFEISQLKDTVKKLTSDNKQLKAALNNLFNTLVDKLKSASNSRHSFNASMLADKIFNTNVECFEKAPAKCNCMSVILSTYNTEQSLTCNQCDMTPQNKKITDVLKYEDKIFGCSSEDLIIPDSLEWVNEQETQEDGSQICCNNFPGESSKTEEILNTPEMEPFIIEPDA